MKSIRIVFLSFFLFFILNIAFTEDNIKGFYTQLIGFQGGGEFYVNTYLSDWSSGVFFENVMNQWLGLQIEMAKTTIPVTNYSVNGVTVTGNGERDYIEMGGGMKFYLPGVTLGFGILYNNFLSGYLVDLNSIYHQMSNKEINFFSIYFGPELTAQISGDLFTKVGIRIIYGLIPDVPNYTVGARFFISFAYGI